MAKRILLTENNLSWGVKLNNGEPYYEHIIDFSAVSDSERLAFIGKELFNDPSDGWINYVKNANPKGDRDFDENSFTLQVNVRAEYPTKTTEEMLNKNYAFVFDDETQKLSSWAVQGTTDNNHNIITYRGYRDWMFELDVTKIFDPSKQGVIERAHVKDVENNQWNIGMDSDNAVVESVEQFEDENYRPVNTETIKIDYRSIIDLRGDASTIISLDEANELINNIPWIIVYSQWSWESEGDNKYFGLRIIPKSEWNTEKVWNEDNTKFTLMQANNWDEAWANKITYKIKNANTTSEIDNYYSVFMYPLGNSFWNMRITNTDLQGEKATLPQDLVSGTPYVMKTTINQIPLFKPNPNGLKKIVFLHTQNGQTYNNIYFQFNDADDDEFRILTTGTESTGNVNVIGLRIVPDWLTQTRTFNINDATSYDTDVNKEFIVDNIAKLHKYPYKRYYITTTDEEKIFMMPQIASQVAVQMSYSFTLDSEHYVFKPVAIGDESNYYNNDIRYGVFSQTSNTIQLSQVSTAFGNYIAQNQQQIQQKFRYNAQQQDLLKNITTWQIISSLANATLTLGLSAVTGGVGGAVIGASAGNQAVNTGNTIWGYKQQKIALENDIALQKAQLTDLKYAPNSLRGNGSDLSMWITKSLLQPIYFEEELWPKLKQSVAWYLHMFGSKMPMIAKNINDFLNTKYHFNYIETQDIYQNFTASINNYAKSLLNKSFMNGVTIWHYHGESSFKGVKNYNVNNVDRSTDGN